MHENKLIVSLVSEKSKAPTREPDSVGYDCYAYGDHTLSPGETKIIPIGVNIALPEGCGAFIWDRSSFGAKGIHIFKQLVTTPEFAQDNFDVIPFGGVIDWSYRGQMGVILHSFMPKIYRINHGDRIGQFVIQKCELLEIEVIPMEEYLEIPSVRGSRGLGSSDGQNTAETAQALITGASNSDDAQWKQ